MKHTLEQRKRRTSKHDHADLLQAMIDANDDNVRWVMDFVEGISRYAVSQCAMSTFSKVLHPYIGWGERYTDKKEQQVLP